MPEDRLKLPSGRELTPQELYAEHVRNNPDDRTATPEGVWGFYIQQPGYKVISDKSYLGQLVSNIPGSMMNFVQGGVSAFNPETWKNFASAAKGAMWDSYVPVEARTPAQNENVEMADSMRTFLGNRIGHPVETLKNDPVGAVADVSAVLGGGAGVMRGAQAATGSSKAASVANALKWASTYTNPTAWVTKPIAYGLDKAGVSDYLYRSSLVPLADQTVEDVDRAVQFGLRNPNGGQVPAGRKGKTQLQGRVREMTQMFDDKAFEAAQAGRTYDPMRASGEIQNVIADVTGASNAGKTSGKITPSRTFPTAMKESLVNREREFLERHGGAVYDKSGNMVTPPQPMSPVDARAIWKGANAELGEALMDKPADLSAVSAGVRAVRQSIVDDFRTWFPELKDAGQREALMIDLRNMIDAEIKRGLGIGSPSSNVYALAHTYKSAAGMTMEPIAAATFAKHLLTPGIRSRIALALANRHPATVRAYASPVFWGLATSANAQSAEPPTPPATQQKKESKPQEIKVDPNNWFTPDTVPEAHR